MRLYSPCRIAGIPPPARGYGTSPVLVDTVVEIPRYVGTTQGRGRYDRDRPRKDVWLRPLRRDWQRILNC